MQKLLDIPSGQLIASGIFPALKGTAPAFWRDGANVVFGSGKAKKAPGTLKLATTAGRPTGAATVGTVSDRRAYYGIGQNAYMYQPLVGVTAIGAMAASNVVWTFAPAGNVTLLANGTDQVEYWPNAGLSAPITPPPGVTRAQLLAKYYDYFLMAQTNVDEISILNSAFADPTEWNAGVAGFKTIRDTESGIRQMLKMGSAMGVYTGSELYAYQLTGDSSRFAVNRLLKGDVGACSAYSVVPTQLGHCGLLPNSAFITDGATVEAIDEPAMRGYLEANLDLNYLHLIYGWYDRLNQCARWWFPTGATTRKGIGYRIKEGTWCRFEDEFSIGCEPGAFTRALLWNASGLHEQGQEYTDFDSVTQEAWVETKPLDCGLSDKYKQLEAIEVDGRWTTDKFLVDVGQMDKPTDGETTPVVEWIYTDLPVRKVITFEPREMPYVVLRFHSEDAAASWEISSLRLYGEPAGWWS